MDCTFQTEQGKFNYRVGVIIHSGRKVLMARNPNEERAFYYSVGGRVRFGESIEEAATCSLQIEGESVLQSQLAKNNAGGRREFVIGCGSGNNKRVNGIRISTSLLQKLLGSLAGHVARTQTFLGEDAALLNAHTGGYPFVTGIDHARELLVGEDVVGHIASDTCDYGLDLTHCYYSLLYGLLDDSNLATIVSASRAYCVIYIVSAAVRAYCQCRCYCLIVSSSLKCTSL